ncbi:MAG: hypothetical protein PHP92_05030 [Candidatus Nanoarchaeia archaeon]|nr:hypothetical protein [Candidatus Nanoarchaeia archaeon]
MDNKRYSKTKYITNIILGFVIGIIIIFGILGMVFDKEKENNLNNEINDINNRIDIIEQWVDSVEKNGINIR